MGGSVAATGAGGGSVERDRGWREGHLRNHWARHGVRLAAICRPARDSRRGAGGALAAPRRGDPRQDAHHGVRLLRSGPNAESAQPRAHAGRQFERFRGGGGGGYGSIRAWHANAGIGDPPGGVLRHRGIQANVRIAADGRRSAIRAEPRHGGFVRGVGGRDAVVLGPRRIRRGEPGGASGGLHAARGHRRRAGFRRLASSGADGQQIRRRADS